MVVVVTTGSGGGVVVVGCVVVGWAVVVRTAWVATVVAVAGLVTWITATSENGDDDGGCESPSRPAMVAPPASTAPTNTATKLARRDALPRRDPYTDGDRITPVGVG